MKNARKNSCIRWVPGAAEENVLSSPNQISCSGEIRARGDVKSVGATERQSGGVDSVTLDPVLRIDNFA